MKEDFMQSQARIRERELINALACAAPRECAALVKKLNNLKTRKTRR